MNPKQLDTDLLRTFLTVARYGNVTRAAETLHRTQSAVSIQIKRLESVLSTTLFRRQPRGVTLTEAGERLRPAAERIIQELDHTLQTFRADPIGGLIRVGVPDEYGSDVLPRILADFTARYPAAEVFVQCGFSVDFPRAVSRGELDLAVFADESTQDNSGVLATEPLVWAAARPVNCSADETLAIAVFDRACWWRDIAIDALRAAGQPYRVLVSSESVAGIKAAILSGLAIGVLARSTVESSMHILGARHKFPALPQSVLRLIGEQRSSPTVAAMSEAIINGFGGLGGSPRHGDIPN